MNTPRQQMISLGGLLVILGASSPLLFAAAPQAVVIQVNAEGTPIVERVTLPLSKRVASTPGLLVTESGRWSVLPAEAGPLIATQRSRVLETTATRSRGLSVNDQQVITMTGSQLDQLLGGEVVRDLVPGAFLTPADQGTLLNPKLTIRRMPLTSDPKYPEDECILFRGRNEILRMPFPAGQAVIRWPGLTDLPASLAEGLPPGRYLLKLRQGDAESRFAVRDQAVVAARLSEAKEMATLLKDEKHPLAVQVAVDALMRATDEDGLPQPLLCDALDQLDGETLTPFLAGLRRQIEAQLRGEHLKAEPNPLATGIEPIDRAQRLILRGQWAEALTYLAVPDNCTPRHRALATLYQGVVLAESGAATAEVATAAFEAAIEEMAILPPADRYRAHNNYANFLLRRAQDRLHGYAMQSATGTRAPLFDALLDWQAAATQYKQALTLAESVGREEQEAVLANQARLHVLLADLMQTLNSELEDGKFAAGEQAARTTAAEAARRVLESGEATTHAAVAAEVLAHLAYRSDDHRTCREYARRALDVYQQLGSLAGAEGVHRLLGLSFLATSRAMQSEEKDSDERESAYRHLLLSHHLAEILRRQFPSDATGQSRAGFFARRAYVSEKLIELYIEREDPLSALRFLELSKARALQDVLQLAGRSMVENPPDESLAELIDTWPNEFVSLEYFIGTERVWLFLIAEGNVQVFPLLATEGNPLRSVQLVAEVQRFLNATEGTASKMLSAASAGRRFDFSWQVTLHDFYHTLLPAAVRSQIGGRKNVVIVPHHILHYFPFAALVTEVDPAPRKPLETVMPKFWIEDGVNITCAPSLIAWANLRRGKPQEAEEVHAIGLVRFASAAPLPGVEKDLANLHRVFGRHVTSSNRGQSITESTLQRACEFSGLLFIGTHGHNLPDAPLASYLLCNPDEENDGRLTAIEIYERPMRPTIVILSACYSGLADRTPLPGDDLFGLQRALLTSGVSTVVDGLWDVYDDTGPEIMHGLFRHLAEGATTPTALAEAQREFLQERRREGPGDPWIHPYFWAVYKSSGSDLTRFKVSSE